MSVLVEPSIEYMARILTVAMRSIVDEGGVWRIVLDAKIPVLLEQLRDAAPSWDFVACEEAASLCQGATSDTVSFEDGCIYLFRKAQ